MEGARAFIGRYKIQLSVAAAVALAVVIFSALYIMPEEPVPPPPAPTPEPTLTPTPTPTPTATPTPTPQPLATVIPSVHAQFAEYRFSHFAYEYGVCFHEEFLVEELADSPARFHTAAAEEIILKDLRGAVLRLLDAYDTGACAERPDFAVHAGRGKWLRYWSTQWGW